MSVILSRCAMSDIMVEAAGPVDRQGKVTYGAGVTIQARVVKDQEFLQSADGSQVKLIGSIWIDGAQSTLPGQGDRVTADGLVGIVETRDDAVTLGGVLDHVTLRLREVG